MDVFRRFFERIVEECFEAGLFQRVAVTVGFDWLALLALCLLQSSPES